MGKEQGLQILANPDSNFSSGILDCRQNTIFFFFFSLQRVRDIKEFAQGYRTGM